MENVKFSTVLHNMALEENQILDYDFKASRLKEDDIVQYWSSTGKNYSVAGFEIRLQRHALQYIVQYYLTTGLFVVVSWVIYEFNYENYVVYISLRYEIHEFNLLCFRLVF